jgi:hypothetical protein
VCWGTLRDPSDEKGRELVVRVGGYESVEAGLMVADGLVDPLGKPHDLFLEPGDGGCPQLPLRG